MVPLLTIKGVFPLPPLTKIRIPPPTIHHNMQPKIIAESSFTQFEFKERSNQQIDLVPLSSLLPGDVFVGGPFDYWRDPYVVVKKREGFDIHIRVIGSRAIVECGNPEEGSSILRNGPHGVNHSYLKTEYTLPQASQIKVQRVKKVSMMFEF